ncbi:hypothetical protein DFH09DRAFT_1077556 [Mycena vulgaris]|nr:hypothetical protein DFH09DRAFT_1077556 [Mycena vulgaris]
MYHSPHLWILALKPLSCLLTGFFCLGSQLLSLLLPAPLAFHCVTRVCLFYAYQATCTIVPGMPQNESISLDSGASALGSMCGPNDALHARDHTFECHGTTHSRISVFHSDLVTIQKSLQLHAIPTEEMLKAALNVNLDTDHKQMLTESLSHVAAALNISVPGNEWRGNNIDPDIQVHILTGVYESKISSSPLHSSSETQKRYILQLHKGKDTE